MTRHISRGYIEFDASTPEEFMALTKQTLDASESIDASWHDDGHPGPDLLVISQTFDEVAP